MHNKNIFSLLVFEYSRDETKKCEWNKIIKKIKRKKEKRKDQKILNPPTEKVHLLQLRLAT